MGLSVFLRGTLDERIRCEPPAVSHVLRFASLRRPAAAEVLVRVPLLRLFPRLRSERGQVHLAGGDVSHAEGQPDQAAQRGGP